MLVLSRKNGERIYVGDNIVIEVRRVGGNRVSLAIDAPRSVRVLRGELWQSATDFDEAVATDSASKPSDQPVSQTTETIIVSPEKIESGDGFPGSYAI